MNDKTKAFSKDSGMGYSEENWNPYAALFGSVTVRAQLEVYYEAVSYLFGDVADFGCGTAKIAPLLVEKANVNTYTGIDSSKEMVELGTAYIRKVCPPNFQIICSSIEDISTQFSSGVSIQSYYAWQNPKDVLQHIFRSLHNDAVFILATINNNLDLEKVLAVAEREQVGHPNFEAFKRYNLELADNKDINVMDMDDLIRQTHSVGFKVKEAHQKHFCGGLDFLVLIKDDDSKGSFG